MPAKPEHYYLETDGQLFLIKDKGVWRFPKSVKELPCKFKPRFKIPIGDQVVLYGDPKLDHHPDYWCHKDGIVGEKNIDPLVQRAVNRTLPRGAAKVAIIENGKVLMVKGNRGFTKDMWNLPGGFMGYGEHPTVSAKRELFEELGIRVQLGRLIGVYSEWFKRTGGYMLSFIYLGKRLSQVIRPQPEEIKEYEWMPIKRALQVTQNPFARAGLKDYLNKRYP